MLLYAITSRDISRRYSFDDSSVSAVTDSASLARGRHLVEAIAKCQQCHGDDYGGKMLSDSRAFGRLAATNITAGRGGTSRLTDADWERALRHGVAPDGRALIFMPADAFAALSDDDLAAVIGYLQLPASPWSTANTWPRSADAEAATAAVSPVRVSRTPPT